MKSKLIRLRNRQTILEAKRNKPCLDCSLMFPPVVMDFHHARGVKRFGIGDCRDIGRQRLLDEIDKCDLLCSNCHRLRHAHEA